MDSIRGRDEGLYKAIERANDLFLTPAELRRKQNAEAFSKLHIAKPGESARMVPFQ